MTQFQHARRAQDRHLAVLLLRAAGLAKMRALGDVEGHPFHGNQYVDAGEGGGAFYQQRLNLPGDAPRITTRQFANRLSDSGYRAVHLRQELPPRDVRDLEVEGSANLPQAAADGVMDGLLTIKNQAPGLHELVKNNVGLGNFAYGGDALGSAAVTSFGGGGVHILFNSESGVSWDDIKKGRLNSVAVRMAKGLSGDAAVRKLYEGVAIHEIGHVADKAMGNVIGHTLSLELAIQMNGDGEKMFAFLRDKVSPYAAFSPDEAAAEVFTMVVAGERLPRQLRETERLIKSLLSQPYGPPS